MKRLGIERALFVTVVLTAAVAMAQTPRAEDSRMVFLWRALDGWFLDLSKAVAMLQDPFASVRAQTVGVMASNVDARRIPLFARTMGDGDAQVRERLMLAAGRIGPDALALSLQGLQDSTPLVRQAAAWAATHGGVEAFEPLSSHLSKERSRVVLETLLANFWRLGEVPWQAEVSRFADSEDVFLRRAAAYSLSRTGAESARAAQRRLAADPEPVIRATALRGFERGALARPDIEAVEGALGDPDWRVRTAACRVLAAQEAVKLEPAAAKAVAEEFASPQPQLAVSALAAAGRQPAIGNIAELLAIVNSDQSWLAAEALLAVARRQPQAAAPAARAWLESNELWRRRGAARAAVELGEDFELRSASDPEPSVRLAWLESLGEDQTPARRARLLELLAADPDPAVRAQILALLRAAAAAPDVEELIGFYAAWKTDQMPDARAEALIAATAATEGTEERAAILALGLIDPDPAVRAMVVNGARGLGLEIALPGREPRHGKPLVRGAHRLGGGAARARDRH